MSEEADKKVDTNEDADLSGDENPGEEEELGEGWYGASRPAPAAEGPPLPSKEGRRELYTTRTVKVAEDVFSDRVKSDRVWFDADELNIVERDEEAFDVDVSGNKINDEYEVDSKVTRTGDFYVIKSAKHKKTGKAVSIKCIDTNTAAVLGQQVDAMSAELDSFALCGDHPHVLSAEKSKYEGDGTLCFVLESCAGAELFTQISKGEENWTEGDARQLVKQILGAIAHVHSKSLVHRDCSDYVFVFAARDNIDTLKLADFSLAVPASTSLSEECGAPEYQAPEMVKGDTYGAAVDVWAAGILAYTLICGEPPFFDANSIKLQTLIKAAKVEFDESKGWKEVSKEARDFCTSLLQADPSKRPSAADALKHAWLKQEGSGASLTNFKKQLKAHLQRRQE